MNNYFFNVIVVFLYLSKWFDNTIIKKHNHKDCDVNDSNLFKN